MSRQSFLGAVALLTVSDCEFLAMMIQRSCSVWTLSNPSGSWKTCTFLPCIRRCMECTLSVQPCNKMPTVTWRTHPHNRAATQLRFITAVSENHVAELETAMHRFYQHNDWLKLKLKKSKREQILIVKQVSKSNLFSTYFYNEWTSGESTKRSQKKIVANLIPRQQSQSMWLTRDIWFRRWFFLWAGPLRNSLHLWGVPPCRQLLFDTMLYHLSAR